MNDPQKEISSRITALADLAYCYDIKNLEGKRVVATIGTHYGQATLNSIQKGD